MASVFETLNAINVNEHKEEKTTGKDRNGRPVTLSYLSWAWAWAEVKKAYPEANYTIYERPDGCIYWTDGRTCWVKTGVTIEGLEHIEYLPVMDYRNQSILLDNITSMDVNKAIQRSLTKAAARHGLGLYIYAGEDLPEGETEPENSQNNDKPAPQNNDQPKASDKPAPQATVTTQTPEEARFQAMNTKVRDLKAKLRMSEERFNSCWKAVVDAGMVPKKKWSEMTNEEFIGFLTAIESNFYDRLAAEAS